MLAISIFQVINLVLHTETEEALVLFSRCESPETWLLASAPEYLNLVAQVAGGTVREGQPFGMPAPLIGTTHDRYEHYKGKFYRVLGIAEKLGAPNEAMVVYYREGEPDFWFARPRTMFFGTTTIDLGMFTAEVKRFTPAPLD